MIQTQSQNEEIRQIIMVGRKVRYEVLWKIQNRVWDKVWYKVRDKVWRKLFK